MEDKLKIFFKLGRLDCYHLGFIVSVNIDRKILSKIARVVEMSKDLNDTSISIELSLKKFNPSVYAFTRMMPPDYPSIDEVFPVSKGNVCRDLIIPESLSEEEIVIGEVKIVVRCSKVFFVLEDFMGLSSGIRLDNNESWKEIVSSKLNTV